jgi:hypothetical protein
MQILILCRNLVPEERRQMSGRRKELGHTMPDILRDILRVKDIWVSMMQAMENKTQLLRL